MQPCKMLQAPIPAKDHSAPLEGLQPARLLPGARCRGGLQLPGARRVRLPTEARGGWEAHRRPPAAAMLCSGTWSRA